MSIKMEDLDAIQTMKDRIADRYTSSELCELIDVPIEDLIEEYWFKIVQTAELFEGVFNWQDYEGLDDE